MQGEEYMSGRATGAAVMVATAAAAAAAAALASAVPLWFCIACPVSRTVLWILYRRVGRDFFFPPLGW